MLLSYSFPCSHMSLLEFANNDFRPLFFLFLYPPLLDQMAKFQGGAIHDRDLALHLDQQIRDPVTMKHGEKMLHGADHNAFAAKRGGGNRWDGLISLVK